MTTSFQTALPDLVILNGQVNSNEIYLLGVAHDAYMIGIGGPNLGADAGKTYKIQVSFQRDLNGSITWLDLVDTLGNNVNAPGSLQARIYTELVTFPRMRLVASGAVGADRTFSVAKADTI